MKLRYNELNLKEYEAHSVILSKIRCGSKVLDLGCVSGYLGNYITLNKNCEVWGVDYDQDLAKKAKKVIKKVFVSNLDHLTRLKLPKHGFDFILLADVLEHVLFYEKLLKEIKSYMKTDGKLIISTPNIAHLSIRFNLLFGRFNYQEKGILDRTHVHFFTKKSLIQLLKKQGYIVEDLDYSADFGQIPYIGRFLRHLSKNLQYFITERLETILAVQFIFTCKKK